MCLCLCKCKLVASKRKKVNKLCKTHAQRDKTASQGSKFNHDHHRLL